MLQLIRSASRRASLGCALQLGNGQFEIGDLCVTVANEGAYGGEFGITLCDNPLQDLDVIGEHAHEAT